MRAGWPTHTGLLGREVPVTSSSVEVLTLRKSKCEQVGKLCNALLDGCGAHPCAL